MESELKGIDENISNEEHDQYEEDEFAVQFVQRVKLAVAVAVIQSTPDGITPVDYARSLVQTFSTDVDKWKEKCQKQEQEMLNIQQRMEVIQIKNQLDSQLPGYESWQNDVTMTVPDTFQSVNSVCENQTYITAAINFVKNYILLNTVSHTNSLLSNYCDDELAEKRSDLILQTVSNIFDYLRCEDGLKLELDIAMEAVKEMMGLFNVSSTKLSKDLTSLCLDFVDSLLVDIHHTIELNKIEDQHRRSVLIQAVAEQKSLTVLILRRLLREITVTSDFLEDLFSPNNDNLSPLLHAENTYYILQSTEGVLEIIEQQKSSLNALKIPESLMCEWEKNTSRSLSVLGEHFPMYCIYVYSLKATIKSLFAVNQDED